jgi:1,4-alpha-glucan branching enzyme
LQDLDFGEPITGQLILDVCRYWLDTFGIDGIRFDNTVNFYVPGNLRGLPEILAGVTAHVADKGESSVPLILEHIDMSAAQVTNDTVATSFWDNSLYGLTFDALWNDRIDSGFLNGLNNRRFLSEGKVPTLYLSNHDHSHAAWQSGARENLGAVARWWKLQPFLIALFTSTAVPLIHNGQEFGEEHFLPEDDQGTGRRVTGRPLRWKLRSDPIGKTLTALHARLARTRHGRPALRSAFMYPAEWPTWHTQFNPVGVGVDVARQLVVYHRWAPTDTGVDNIVVVLNFSGSDEVVEVPFPIPGQWTDLLASFNGAPEWSVDVTAATARVPVGSHWGRILWRFNPAVR